MRPKFIDPSLTTRTLATTKLPLSVTMTVAIWEPLPPFGRAAAGSVPDGHDMPVVLLVPSARPKRRDAISPTTTYRMVVVVVAVMPDRLHVVVPVVSRFAVGTVPLAMFDAFRLVSDAPLPENEPPVIVPLSVGEAESTTDPEPVELVTPVPPFPTGSVPVTSAVRLTAPKLGAPPAFPCNTVVVLPS